MRQWYREQRRNSGKTAKKSKSKHRWNKIPDEQKKGFIKNILMNKEKADHFRTLTQEVMKEEGLDDRKPAAAPFGYNTAPPQTPTYYGHYGPPAPPPPPPTGSDSNITLLPTILVLN